MQHFTMLGNVDVLPLRLQIEQHPECWDQHTGRTAPDGSPHAEISDIWLRWRPEHATGAAPESYNEPFAELAWYPAMAKLPAARGLLMNIMQRVEGTALGGCLITRIRPGCQVKPHSDAMSWHAQRYSLKAYTIIRTTPNVVQWVDGENFVPKAGDVFLYDNKRPHAVYNEGDEDRWTMMAAICTD